MRYKSYLLSATAASALLFALGCSVGPNFKSPPAPDVKSYVEGELPAQTTASPTDAGAAQTFQHGQGLPDDWWKLFQSPALDRIVEQALKANPDIQAAKATLRQAQEMLSAQEGTFLPAVDFSFSPTRQKFSSAAFGRAGTPSSIFTLYNASVDVGYGLDIFGGNRRLTESYKAQAEYRRFELEAAYLTLTTNVVTAALQEASLREQLKATQEIIGLQKRQFELLNTQFELGAIAKTAVLQQQTEVAQSEALLPALQKQLAAKRHQLAALLGNVPEQGVGESFTFADMRLPENLPVSLPSAFTRQRPDIRAAEEQMHAASAEIGVATANMLPKVTLSASYGSTTTDFGDLFKRSTEVWSFGANILQPLFHGGTLLHERRAAVAAYDSAAAGYKSTVLNAFREVADTLRALQYDADALALQETAWNSAKGSYDLVQIQYKEGAISYPQLLDVQRAYEQTRINLIQAQAARFVDTAALFQALGGGWNKSDLPPPEPVMAEPVMPAPAAVDNAAPEPATTVPETPAAPLAENAKPATNEQTIMPGASIAFPALNTLPMAQPQTINQAAPANAALPHATIEDRP